MDKPTPGDNLANLATKEWPALAGEPVSVEHISGALYAFGSELACLRLHYKMKTGRVGFSEGYGSTPARGWYYMKDVVFSPEPLAPYPVGSDPAK